MLFALALAFIIPVSLLFWFINIVFVLVERENEGVWQPISPGRCIMAFTVPLAFAKWGLSRGSLDMSGALAGILVGFVMTLSNYCFLAALFGFFFTASKATKFRSRMKVKLEEDFREGGQRNWVQVICNGGVATELAILYMMEVGCREVVTDFTHAYSESWLAMAVMGAFACSSGDTYASEFGTVIGSSEPVLITTLQKVPRGTNGGVSLPGLIASALGGLVVGLAYYVALLLSVSPETLVTCPPQWPVILVGGLAGFLGSLIDSVMGATVQFSGYHEEKKCIVEQPGPGVVHICGTPTLDNHSVNLMASFITALLTPTVAFNVWYQFV